ncbi:S-layer homology domain-containing protein [Cloacibacillus evryensis]|uniref:S-layer homology domain-containing protein n=1 Tax=Cloacibacillus evryensis TaxID=508460 RepID=UPI002109BABB|nr:S-layer homology domain-containing protein [Cloacibacillus evryensis]MCQ4763310.1 S-layer homology domain-containing protein [Cloacibacillus evryensis]
MASVVARALVAIDADKASKQDLELLKKLVMEFKDELDALGVKVDKLDKRVAVLEDRLGGWKLRGQMYFDAKFMDNDSDADNNDKEFGFGRARLFLSKQIDENTSLMMRINSHKGDHSLKWDRFYVDSKLPYDINFRFGRFNFDWESDLGLYDPYTVNNDATFGDWDVDGFQFAKTWGMFDVTAIVGRNATIEYNDGTDTYGDANTHMTYALKVGANVSEKWMLGAMAYWWKGDNLDIPVASDLDVDTYGFYAGYNFTPAVQLKGVYYWQKIDGVNLGGLEDSPKSWKAILDVKQDLLKFTALWIEYAQQDNTFVGTNSYDYMGENEMDMKPFNNGTAKIWNIIADQKWNDKWGTYLRYWQADWDTEGLDDTKDWTIGVRYQYTPAIQFKLEYDSVDYGTAYGLDMGKDNIFRFRTTVNF